MPMSPSSPRVRIPGQPKEFVGEYNEIDWGEEIMAREGLQLTSWNLANLKYVDEKFWLAGRIWHFRCFHGNMNDWILP